VEKLFVEHATENHPRGSRKYYSSHGLQITSAGKRALKKYQDQTRDASKQEARASSQDISKMSTIPQSASNQGMKMSENVAWMVSFMSKMPPNVQNAIAVSIFNFLCHRRHSLLIVDIVLLVIDIVFLISNICFVIADIFLCR